MFRTRLISGAILIGAAIASLILGGWVLYFVTLVLSLVGAFEFYRAVGLRAGGDRPRGCEIAGYIGIGLFYFGLVSFRGERFAGAKGELSLALLALILVMLLFVYVFGYPRFSSDDMMRVFFGVVYVGVMLSFLYQTRLLPNGKFLVWLIVFASWGCDTGAYCVGMLLGRHQLTPALSPKKTIEGAVGGVVFSAVLALIFALATKGPVRWYVLICVVGALISMVGDLAASAIKRNFGIKDFGHLIPGHGGVLDRFDSVLFVAPVVYFFSAVLL